MAISIVPHGPQYREGVLAFNERMRAGGSPWGFYVDPVPRWIPWCSDAPAWREYHLAVEDDLVVRGAYALKPQEWSIRGRISHVADWQGPFSEGAIDARYSTLGLRFVRDMLKKYPLLYSIGHGGFDEPMVKLLRSLQWTLHEMPFCLKIVHPFKFIRKNNYLRRSRRNSILLDVMAFSGIGAAGILTVQAARRRNQHCTADAVVVDSFGDWADDLWKRNRDRYCVAAVRDRRMMNHLVPPTGFPGGTRLLITRGDATIGWSLVHHRQMSDDLRFGSLNVGLITDCFAAPEDAEDVITATHDYLAARGVDMVYSNQSHPAWIDGFRRNGYFILPRKRLFAMSPKLRDSLEPLAESLNGLHLTNLDGHGPSGFGD